MARNVSNIYTNFHYHTKYCIKTVNIHTKCFLYLHQMFHFYFSHQIMFNIHTSLRFIRRLTPYNVSVRTWASCAVELTSGHELITSFRLLRFYFSPNFYVSHIIGKLGICSFQRYATLKNLSSRKGAVIS